MKKDKKERKNSKKSTADKGKVLVGREAMDALAEAFEAEGLLTDENEEGNTTEKLQARLAKLELEVNFIKDLLGRSIHLDDKQKSILKG
jgi:hypothetical protein